MKQHEHIKPVGIFRLKVFKKGVLIEEYEDKNLIVNQGRNHIAQLLGGGATDPIDTIGFGEGSATPAAGDTGLTNDYTKPIGAVSYPSTGQLQIDWSLETSEGNGMAITEFGLFWATYLFARKTRAAINKDSDIRLEGTWTINF
jgi:hypothetical protein